MRSFKPTMAVVALSACGVLAASAYADDEMTASGTLTIVTGDTVEEFEVPVVAREREGEPAHADLYSLFDLVEDPLLGTIFEVPEGTIFETESEDGATVSVSGIGDSDPFIQMGLAITDTGAPSSFSFTFRIPILVVPGATAVQSSFSASFTDGDGAGFTMTPLTPGTVPITAGPAITLPEDSAADDGGVATTEILVAGVSNAPAGPYTSMGVDVGPAFSTGPVPGNSGLLPISVDPLVLGSKAGPTGPWTWLAQQYTFRTSGGGDTFTFNGRSEIINIIPLPAAGWAGLPVLAAMAWIKRRNH